MAPTYSLLTTIYDTDSVYFLPLAESLLKQSRNDFEWVALDNGSSDPETLKAIDMIAGDPRVKLSRVPENLGIIGGMRHVFERATGRYILPLDSDDLLADGFLEVIDRAVALFPEADAFYSDEALLRQGQIHDVYQKPTFDPLFLLHSCYIAHLCVFDRALAERVGVYTDFATQGSHDWDTYVRFMKVDAKVRRINETLYFWRMHEQSTSQDITSKDYIESSHQAVLNKWITHKGLDQEVALQKSRHWGLPGNWEFYALTPQSHKTLSLAQLDDQSGWNAAEWLVIDTTGAGLPDDVINDAIATARLFDDVGLMAGGTKQQDTWIDGPRYLGHHWAFITSNITDPGYFGRTLKAHACDLISSQLIVIRRDILGQILDWLTAVGTAPDTLSMPVFSLLASFWAKQNGISLIYHPNLNISIQADDLLEDNYAVAATLGLALADLVEREPASGFEFPGRRVSSTQPRLSQILMDLTMRGEVDATKILTTQALTRTVHRSDADRPELITVITSVYIETPADLFSALCQRMRDQAMQPSKWIVIRNGPVDATIDAILEDLATLEWVQVLEIEINDGIAPALRLGIGAVTSEYFVVIDADDLIVPDAIAYLSQVAEANDHPEIIYTDEFIAIDGQPQYLCCREPFDAVLHGDNSSIWHLIAVRKSALDMEKLLAKADTQWATDWEFIANVQRASPEARVLHCPQALYIWQQHNTSISNNETGDDRSVLSQKAVLEAYICAPGMQVDVWPLNRGAVEMYATAPLAPLDGLIHMTPSQFIALDGAGLATLRDTVDMVLLSSLNVCAATAEFYQEMQRLLLLHQDLDAVTGHVLSRDGTILQSPEVWRAERRYQPWAGKLKTDPGPFAVLQKPRTVSRIVADNAAFAIAKASLIQAELKSPTSALNVAWSPLLSRIAV